MFNFPTGGGGSERNWTVVSQRGENSWAVSPELELEPIFISSKYFGPVYLADNGCHGPSEPCSVGGVGSESQGEKQQFKSSKLEVVGTVRLTAADTRGI